MQRNIHIGPRSMGSFGMPLVKTARRTLLLAALITAGAAAHAEDDVIVTDRPDFVESSETVGMKHFQIEVGVEHDKESGDGNAWFMPTLFRFGLAERWELRLETDGYTRVSEGQGWRTNGWSDASFGVKYHVAGSGENGAPSMAWLLHVDLPTGSEELRGHGARPSLRWVGEWELPNEFSIGVMPGLIYDTTDDGRRFLGGIAGVTLGKDFNERTHAFVELAAPQIASERNGGTDFEFSTGAALKLDDHTQIDTALSFGLTHDAPDVAFGVGFSHRW